MVNITRQSPVLSLFTLVIISIVSIFNIPEVDIESGIDIGGIYGALLLFQSDYYLLSVVICGFLVVLTGFYAARLSIQYGLFAGHSSLSMPIYGLFACSFGFMDNYLIVYLSSFLLILAVRCYCSGYKLHSYGFSSLFSGSMILGLMPYVYPPSIPLLLILPFIILIFKRSSREFIVSTAGFLLTSLVISYILWLRGDGVLSYIITIFESLTANGSAIRQLGETPSGCVVLATYLTLVVIAYICYLRERYLSTKKARRIVIFNMSLTLCCLFMLLLPSSITAVVVLLAIPVSIFIPILLIRIDASISAIIYATFVVLWLLSLFF